MVADAGAPALDASAFGSAAPDDTAGAAPGSTLKALLLGVGVARGVPEELVGAPETAGTNVTGKADEAGTAAPSLGETLEAVGTFAGDIAPGTLGAATLGAATLGAVSSKGALSTGAWLDGWVGLLGVAETADGAATGADALELDVVGWANATC